jgi:hypothetical protein
LQTPHEAIEANFGLTPFKFDIEKYMDVSLYKILSKKKKFSSGIP